MSAIASAMSGHHSRCDDLFAAALAKVSQESWDDATSEFKRFHDEMELHMRGEETVLFPAFESTTGIQAGPTIVMRQEHDRMRPLLTQIEMALGARDPERVDGYTSTLLILMQQHNLKEENILYPMIDAALHDRAPELVAQLDLGRNPMRSQ
jgi:iron-sulfur cluster repair protein YtfE (RIC family)